MWAQLLVAECWYPSNDVQEIRDSLVTSARPGSMPAILNEIHPKDKRPTYPPCLSYYQHVLTRVSLCRYFKTNKFTNAFQSIIDAYGVATYQEANPSTCEVRPHVHAHVVT